MSKLILALLIVAALAALSDAGRVRRDVICGVRGHRSLPLSSKCIGFIKFTNIQHNTTLSYLLADKVALHITAEFCSIKSPTRELYSVYEL